MSQLIAYRDEPHPLTGMTNARLATWLFIASETMLFGALISAYVMIRAGSIDWPSGALSLPLGSANTLFLVLSSLTMMAASREAVRGKRSYAGRYLAATIGLGVLFLAVKGIEYGQKISGGYLPATHNFYALYFVLTGVHMLHLLGGIGYNAYLLVGTEKLWRERPEMVVNRFQCATLYWNYVDVVWLVLFAMLYVIERGGR